MATNTRESLEDFVRRVRKEKGLSTPDIERISGGTITDGYVSQIENGYIKNVSPEKLIALAKGLGVSEEEIFAVARQKPLGADAEDEELQVLFYRYKTLSKKDKEELKSVWGMVKAEVDRRLDKK